VLALEDITYSFLNYFTALPFILLLCMYEYGLDLISLLTLLLGLSLIWLTALGLCMTLGVLAFFFRDVLELVKAVMRLGFLVTPIIWVPSRLEGYEYLVWFNPFYSYIDLCRSALLGQTPHINSIFISLTLSVVLNLIGFVVLTSFGDNIRTKVFLS